MNSDPIGFRVLKKSRRNPEPGDIFCFQLNQTNDRYFFGRVVAVDTKIGGIEGLNVILIYIYKKTSMDNNSIPTLEVSDLLVPPIGTNARPWVRGYFETVGRVKNKASDLLCKHSFRDVRGLYFDEHGSLLSTPSEPIGEYGVSGIGGIYLKIKKSLDLP